MTPVTGLTVLASVVASPCMTSMDVSWLGPTSPSVSQAPHATIKCSRPSCRCLVEGHPHSRHRSTNTAHGTRLPRPPAGHAHSHAGSAAFSCGRVAALAIAFDRFHHGLDYLPKSSRERFTT